MHLFEGTCATDLYRRQLFAILDHGHDVMVRGLRTRELLDVATIIQQPLRRPHIVPGRYANPYLALSEALHVLAGRDDVASLARHNKRIGQFSDDGRTLYGAYGYRIKDQLPHLIERLRRDPHDRRAVLTIWQPQDLWIETKDPPCNDMVMFKLRDGRLHMTVINRSNDLHWGLYAVNVYQFSFLQEYIAARLRVEIGTQTHLSNSLHIYLDGPGAEITRRMVAARAEPLPDPPPNTPLLKGIMEQLKPEAFLDECNAILDNHPPPWPVEFWFARRYLDVESYDSFADIENRGLHPSWIAAAKEFERRPRGARARP